MVCETRKNTCDLNGLEKSWEIVIVYKNISKLYASVIFILFVILNGCITTYYSSLKMQ